MSQGARVMLFTKTEYEEQHLRKDTWQMCGLGPVGN